MYSMYAKFTYQENETLFNLQESENDGIITYRDKAVPIIESKQRGDGDVSIHYQSCCHNCCKIFCMRICNGTAA